jgi:hypothetical protein
VLVAVYGAAQPKFKEAFLTELVNTCSKESLPLLVGGGVVISTLYEILAKKVMTNLMGNGLSYLMLL